MVNIESIIAAASGREKADTLFVNGRVINVFTGEILEQNVAVKDGYICGVESNSVGISGYLIDSASQCNFDQKQEKYEANRIVDLEGMYLAPGFIDAHVHIESSMVTPVQFARGVVPCGTTTVVADPHEIANVMGIEGIEYMIRSAENQPMNILFALPSCVPATFMETSGAILDANKIAPFLRNEKIVALAEIMNYPGVIFTDPDLMAKIKAAHNTNKIVDGHAPKVSGKNLNAYISAGIYSDHECTTANEALEKIRLGIHVMVREGTCAKNLDDLIPAINDNTWHQMMWCTDDRHPDEILTEGHIDHIVRKAIKAGIPPVRAIQMATINCSRYFGIKNVGAIAPNRRADMVVFKDINNPVIEKVYVKGELVAQSGQILISNKTQSFFDAPNIMNFNLDDVDFSIKFIKENKPLHKRESTKARVIKVIPNQVVTAEVIMDVLEDKLRESEFQVDELQEDTLEKDRISHFGNSNNYGYAVSDISRDMLKIAVIERYSGKTGMAKGFVNGLGLKRGAIASTVAHDSHNLIVAGADDFDMLCAVKAIKEMGGGFVVVCNKEIIASLALPVAGLMSEDTLTQVNYTMAKVISAAKSLGSDLSDPFMSLGFLALPVIPSLKITDKGVVDVGKFQIVDIFI